MVKIEKIKPPVIDVYGPGDTFLGELNEYEFLDLREQISDEQASGYYIMFKGQKIEINLDGDLASYSAELEDMFLQPLF